MFDKYNIIYQMMHSTVRKIIGTVKSKKIQTHIEDAHIDDDWILCENANYNKPKLNTTMQTIKRSTIFTKIIQTNIIQNKPNYNAKIHIPHITTQSSTLSSVVVNDLDELNNYTVNSMVIDMYNAFLVIIDEVYMLRFLGASHCWLLHLL